MFEVEDELARGIIIGERGAGGIPARRFGGALAAEAFFAKVGVQRQGALPAAAVAKEAEPGKVLGRDQADAAMVTA